MKRSILTAMCAALLLTAPAQAQNDESVALGFGLRNFNVAFEDFFTSGFAPRVHLAFRPSETLIVEPSLGFFRFSRESQSDVGTSSSTVSIIAANVGFLFTDDIGSDGLLYWGPRVGLLRFSSESDFGGGGSGSEQSFDLQAAVVTGGEFYIVPRFGLGGEVGLEYTRLGDGDDDQVEESGSLLGTFVELRVRWYLR